MTTWQSIGRDGTWLILPDSIPRRVLCEAALDLLKEPGVTVAVVKQEWVRTTTYAPATLILALLRQRPGLGWQWAPLGETPVRDEQPRPRKRKSA